jgi:hypothetical protein
MTKSLIPFIKKISILTLSLCVFYFVFFFFVNPDLFLPVFFLVILFLYCLTLIVHNILIKSSKDRLAKFSVNFMIATSIKLVLYTIFIVLYLISDKQNAIPFVAFFLFNYFIFTIFEVYSITKELKSIENK